MRRDEAHILSTIAKAQTPACLALVADTWGSAPRATGSCLAIFADGSFEGSVSGGCIEADVITSAVQALQDNNGDFLLKHFGIGDAQAWEAGLACGGKMQVIILPLTNSENAELIKSLAEALQNRRAALLAVQAGNNRLSLWIDGQFHAGDKSLTENPHIDASDFHQKSRLIESTDTEKPILLACYPPPLRLVILGAVHIAVYLAPMATACGYDVHIIDPRAAWLHRPAIESLSATLHEDWSDTALSAIRPDSHTAFVALTHDPKLDDPAFAYLFGDDAADCFYIGALGSTKTHANRTDRLKQAGIADGDIGCIRAPIGLDIGAANPAEIAVAILAEMTQALRVRQKS